MAGGRRPETETVSLSSLDRLLSSCLPSPLRKTAVFLLLVAAVCKNIPQTAAAGPIEIPAPAPHVIRKQSSRGVSNQQHLPSDAFSNPSSFTAVGLDDLLPAPSTDEQVPGSDRGTQQSGQSRRPFGNDVATSATGNEEAAQTKIFRQGSVRKSRKPSHAPIGAEDDASTVTRFTDPTGSPNAELPFLEKVVESKRGSTAGGPRGSRSIAKRRSPFIAEVMWQQPFQIPQDLLETQGTVGADPQKAEWEDKKPGDLLVDSVLPSIAPEPPHFALENPVKKQGSSASLGLTDGDTKTGDSAVIAEQAPQEVEQKERSTGSIRQPLIDAMASVDALPNAPVTAETEIPMLLGSAAPGRDFASGPASFESPPPLPLPQRESDVYLWGGSFFPGLQGTTDGMLAQHRGDSTSALLSLLAGDNTSLESQQSDPLKLLQWVQKPHTVTETDAHGLLNIGGSNAPFHDFGGPLQLPLVGLQPTPAFSFSRTTGESGGEHQLPASIDHFLKGPPPLMKQASPSVGIASVLRERADQPGISPFRGEAAPAHNGSTPSTVKYSSMDAYHGLSSETSRPPSEVQNRELTPATGTPPYGGNYSASSSEIPPRPLSLSEQAEKAAKLVRGLSSANPLPPELQMEEPQRDIRFQRTDRTQPGASEHSANALEAEGRHALESIPPKDTSGPRTITSQRSGDKGEGSSSYNAASGVTPSEDDRLKRPMSGAVHAQTPESKQKRGVPRFNMGALRRTATPGIQCFATFLSAIPDEDLKQNLLVVVDQDAELTETFAAVSDSDDGRPVSSIVSALDNIGFALRRLGIPKSGEAVFKAGILVRKFRYLLAMFAERLSSGIYQRDTETVQECLSQEVSSALHRIVGYFETHKRVLEQAGVPSIDKLSSDITFYRRIDRLLELYCPPYVELVQHEDGSNDLDFSLLRSIETDPSARELKRQGLLGESSASVESHTEPDKSQAKQYSSGAKSSMPREGQEVGVRRDLHSESQEGNGSTRLAGKGHQELTFEREETPGGAHLPSKEGHPKAEEAEREAPFSEESARENKLLAAIKELLSANRPSSRSPSAHEQARQSGSSRNNPVSPTVVLQSVTEGKEKGQLPGEPLATPMANVTKSLPVSSSARTAHKTNDGDKSSEVTHLESEQKRQVKQRRNDKKTEQTTSHSKGQPDVSSVAEVTLTFQLKTKTKDGDANNETSASGDAEGGRHPDEGVVAGPREGNEDLRQKPSKKLDDEGEQKSSRSQIGGSSSSSVREGIAALREENSGTSGPELPSGSHTQASETASNSAATRKTRSRSQDDDVNIQAKPSIILSSTKDTGVGKSESLVTPQVLRSRAVVLTAEALAFPQATETVVMPGQQAVVAAQHRATAWTGTDGSHEQAAPRRP
ncbi:hypothetical protein TGME49_306890 [Toxoplasma gondii ME49]|uniref:Platelet binding protein GspB, putative n=2 Tax=Toxoplasma gondii TaxID=5811 RepID=A0A125YP55_TOXGV|nr:hypothetical protein TGME49_306890 [Toxoplasma gondii ME49]EPT26345.1 hypothetical protein TGME49_306890 [Toxoplasma gondii ME49]ESS28312.1 putative platelet-binding protein GspB [Toxoplasma gondii VEG]CEL77201.1 TPA: platelet binding protein GspB, putative [Toxoplasma gondii VEG]|eukprot:XP_002371862.1 hypothetical protein TGME49_306890 [Toxoplasma gondii ME49]